MAKKGHKAWNKGLPKEKQPAFGKHWITGKCWNKKEWIKKNCLECGKMFEVTPARRDTANYCSYSCRSKHINPMANIKSKEKMIKSIKEKDYGETYKKEALNRQRENKYLKTYEKGHRSFRGEDWDKVRIKCWQRDNFTCQDCGRSGIQIHPHHIKPYKTPDDNSLDNLITLCNSCHTKREITKRSTA